MSVIDFPPRPSTPPDSTELMAWLDKLALRQNIDNQIALTSVASGDETYVFDVSASATRKATMTSIFNGMGLRFGSGAPSNGDGSDGDYYFRSDGGVATHIYFKSGGVWAGII